MILSGYAALSRGIEYAGDERIDWHIANDILVDLIRSPGSGVPACMNKDTLYFDGGCPLCGAEIDKLRRFSRNRLILKDIHQLDGADADLDRSLLLARLHLKTADGRWVTGLKANIRAWQHTPFGYLWRILDWPLVNRLSYPAYEFWLRRRNRHNPCSVP